jgi:hypothetical protein
MPAEKQTIIAVIMGLRKAHETCPYTSVLPFMVGIWDLSPKLSAPEMAMGEVCWSMGLQKGNIILQKGNVRQHVDVLCFRSPRFYLGSITRNL